MKQRSAKPKSCPQCGADLVSAFDDDSGLTWSICTVGFEEHYAQLLSATMCPECGGRTVLDGPENICTACGRVSGGERFETSIPNPAELGEEKALNLSELMLGHSDLNTRAGKNDLSGRPGTPDFDNMNLGTWTSNRQIRAALGLATRLNERGQFEVVLGEDERRAYAEQIRRRGRAAIVPRSLWYAMSSNRDIVSTGGEKLDPKKDLVILGQERFEVYLRRRGNRLVASVPRSMRGAKQRIQRYEAVCQNRSCQRAFVTQDRRIKYCSRDCRLAEQAARHRKAQRDYTQRAKVDRPEDRQDSGR
jgi:hypothetical protein